MKDIAELCIQKKFQTDKYNLGYLDNFYQGFFDKNYENIHTILEIGVKRGGSLALWNEYFKDCEIHGVDINGPIKVPGTKTHKANAYDKNFTDRFQNEYFDLVIDDGPHTYQSWIDLIDLYYDKIKVDGYLVIEDVILPQRDMGCSIDKIKELIQYAENKGFAFEEEKLMMGLQKTDHLRRLWSEYLSILVFKK